MSNLRTLDTTIAEVYTQMLVGKHHLAKSAILELIKSCVPEITLDTGVDTEFDRDHENRKIGYVEGYKHAIDQLNENMEKL